MDVLDVGFFTIVFLEFWCSNVRSVRLYTIACDATDTRASNALSRRLPTFRQWETSPELQKVLYNYHGGNSIVERERRFAQSQTTRQDLSSKTTTRPGGGNDTRRLLSSTLPKFRFCGLKRLWAVITPNTWALPKRFETPSVLIGKLPNAATFL